MRTLFIVLTGVFIFLGCSKSQENTSEGKAARSEQSERRVVKGDTTITFDDTEAGKMPAGWSNHFTGKGALGKWEIRQSPPVDECPLMAESGPRFVRACLLSMN